MGCAPGRDVVLPGVGILGINLGNDAFLFGDEPWKTVVLFEADETEWVLGLSSVEYGIQKVFHKYLGSVIGSWGLLSLGHIERE